MIDATMASGISNQLKLSPRLIVSHDPDLDPDWNLDVTQKPTSGFPPVLRV